MRAFSAVGTVSLFVALFVGLLASPVSSQGTCVLTVCGSSSADGLVTVGVPGSEGDGVGSGGDVGGDRVEGDDSPSVDGGGTVDNPDPDAADGLPQCVGDGAGGLVVEPCADPLPACVYDGAGIAQNEPCAPPPCLGFVGPTGEFCDAGGAGPPVIDPPSFEVAAAAATAQIVWPVLDDVGPGRVGGLDWVPAGYAHSLTLGSYDWSGLSATAEIERTVVSGGQVFAESFSATVTAVPREVRWDLSQPNGFGLRHDPPDEVICDGPGERGGWTNYDGRFLDWRDYDGYGSGPCEYVFWVPTEWVGAAAVVEAEIVWDLALTTSWAGDAGPVGEHVELFESVPFEIDTFSSVGVLGGGND